MNRRRLAFIALTSVLATGVFAAPAAAAPSCTAQFTSALAPITRPLGQVVVVPEVRTLTLGGRNLGQEVKLFFATADKGACPLTP
jgi:hypothetical protein